MELRVNDSYQKYISDFTHLDIRVVCPKCSQKAIVKSNAEIKIICADCGFNKQLEERPNTIAYINKLLTTDRRKATQGILVIGGAIDPFFHLPLWLTANVEGNTLWAYNYEHLNSLQEHIEAKLRERNGQPMRNQSLGSRLPKWMTSKKNREVVLKKIYELQTK